MQERDEMRDGLRHKIGLLRVRTYIGLLRLMATHERAQKGMGCMIARWLVGVRVRVSSDCGGLDDSGESDGRW